jgi:Tfp pilus assembly protein PilN
MRFQINIHRPGRRPKRVPKARTEERRISVAILIPLLILLLLGVSFVYLRTSSSLDRKIKMNRSRKVYLQSQVKQAEMDLEKLRKERGLISQLEVKRIEWFQKLLDLSEITPDELWLTDVSIKTTKKQKRQKKGATKVIEETFLTIEGVTVPAPGRKSLESIATLISSLNARESFRRDFEPATLVRTHLSREKDRELMKFEISSKLKGDESGVSGGSKEKASQ